MWDAAFWTALTRWRFVALAGAVCAYAIYTWCDVVLYPGDTVPPPVPLMALRGLYGMQQWLWIAAILGFGQRHLRHGGRLLNYLAQGVFPLYIVHQTIIVMNEYWLKPLRLATAQEGLILVAVTVAGRLASYEIVRRVGWLRPLFGLKPQPIMAIGHGVSAGNALRTQDSVTMG